MGLKTKKSALPLPVVTDNGPVDAETVSDSAMTVCVSLCVCLRMYVSIEMSEHLKGRGCREEQIELENKFVKSDESFPESFVEPNGEESLPSRFFRSRSHDGFYFYNSTKSISIQILLFLFLNPNPPALSFPYLFHPTFLCPLSIISI